jgi:hypothetical protein
MNQYGFLDIGNMKRVIKSRMPICSPLARFNPIFTRVKNKIDKANLATPFLLSLIKK